MIKIHIGRALGRFNHREARRLTVQQPWRGVDEFMDVSSFGRINVSGGVRGGGYLSLL